MATRRRRLIASALGKPWQAMQAIAAVVAAVVAVAAAVTAYRSGNDPERTSRIESAAAANAVAIRDLESRLFHLESAPNQRTPGRHR